MPCDYSAYPADWKLIRAKILARAEQKCEQCGIENYFVKENGARVVLTIAHISDPNPMNCDPSNLKALCQRCHNGLDGKMRAQHAKKTRFERRVANGQLALELED